MITSDENAERAGNCLDRVVFVGGGVIALEVWPRPMRGLAPRGLRFLEALAAIVTGNGCGCGFAQSAGGKASALASASGPAVSVERIEPRQRPPACAWTFTHQGAEHTAEADRRRSTAPGRIANVDMAGSCGGKMLSMPTGRSRGR